MPTPKRIGALIFPGWELLDLAGPLEALHMLAAAGGHSELELFTISARFGTVSTMLDPNSRFAQHFVADKTLKQALSLSPPLDMLIIPGGFGAYPNQDNQAYVDFTREVFPKLQVLFTICTGAGIAARAGLLDGLEATTNKQAWDTVTAEGKKTTWRSRARWVEAEREGKLVWTTSGVSAGTDGMVALVARIWGEDAAVNMCNAMEYERQPDKNKDPFGELLNRQDVLP